MVAPSELINQNDFMVNGINDGNKGKQQQLVQVSKQDIKILAETDLYESQIHQRKQDIEDIAAIMQMLLNNGEWKGKKYFNKETVKLFTSYQDKKSRRGLGFDKPERDNTKRNDPYPARAASPETFGHTGFTGTCAWADPKNDLIFIFLSNRIYPEENGVFKTLNIRPKILETIYQCIEK